MTLHVFNDILLIVLSIECGWLLYCNIQLREEINRRSK